MYFTELWWPCFGSLGGFLNNALLLTLFVISFSCYLKSVIVGPGFLPLKWKPVCTSLWISIAITSNRKYLIIIDLYYRLLKQKNSICSFVEYVMGIKHPVFIIVINVFIWNIFKLLLLNIILSSNQLFNQVIVVC